MTPAESTDRQMIPGLWLLPTLAVIFAGGFGDQHVMQGLDAFMILASGILVGLLWQVLNRRDLADRLTFIAVCVCMSAALLALVPSSYLLANPGPGHALAGVLAGAVLGEQILRLRESKG